MFLRISPKGLHIQKYQTIYSTTVGVVWIALHSKQYGKGKWDATIIT